MAEFIVNFRDQLKRHAARSSLNLAACSYKLPRKPDPIQAAPASDAPIDRWGLATDQFEPVRSFDDRYQTYKQIGESFIVPHATGAENPPFSMLLYGPPGTGKTTVAS